MIKSAISFLLGVLWGLLLLLTAAPIMALGVIFFAAGKWLIAAGNAWRESLENGGAWLAEKLS